ncbi:MAG: methanesulfonate monooxygenase [Betaproteobacteria bacterium]
MIPRQSIDELVYRSCMLLDEKDFSGFLELCDPTFHYAITAYSPEIRKEMTWLEHDKAGLKLLFDNLPKHNSDHSTLLRHATVYTVGATGDNGRARVVSALQVFKTTLDGGATELFAVGRLYDMVALEGDTPKLVDRNVRLETRLFGFGFHIPF